MNTDPRLLVNIFCPQILPMKSIVNRAIKMYKRDVGDMGCIGDASCECFACELRSFALDKQREQASIENDFTTEMLRVRDSLEPITSGMIKRQHCVGGREAYGKLPGYRKTMLKDAVSIASFAVAIINRAVRKFGDESLD